MVYEQERQLKYTAAELGESDVQNATEEDDARKTLETNSITLLNPQQVDALLATKSPHTLPGNGHSHSIRMYGDPTPHSTQLVVKNYRKSGLK